MDSPPTHPSFLELDRARLGAASSQTSSHLEGCERCRAHLRTLDAPTPLPPWARELKEAPRSWWRLFDGWRPWAGLVPLAVAMIVLVVISRPRPPPGIVVAPDEEQDLSDKGVPALQLRIERGEMVKDWDTQSPTPVIPGDRLQLTVNGEGFSFVQVATGEGDQTEVLYAGPLALNQPTLLPTSWRVDAQPGNEVLEVVLSRRALTLGEVSAAVAAKRQNRDGWTRTLVLVKQTGPAEAPR